MAIQFGSPFKLLVNQDTDRKITNINSHFAQMVLATGEETSAMLFEIARTNYLDNFK